MTTAARTRRKSKASKTAAPPPPALREGPRPLGFHVMSITTTNFGAMASLASAQLGLFPWHSSLRDEAAALMDEARHFPQTEFGATLAQVATRRLELWLKGVEVYRAHPYRRTLKDPPALWRKGAMRLLDYGKRSRRARENDLTVLFVPSLINPAYVLDLRPERSGMRYLRERGIRPLLVDWGAPGEEERGFDLTDYVVKRLEPALDAAIEAAGGPVAVVGYCMGGNLALALAQRRQKDMSKLALLATPWDFHLHVGAPPFSHTIRLDQFSTLSGGTGEVPVDMLQIFFAMLDPTLVERKYRRFAELDPASEEALDFVAVEDWSNDGMPVAMPAARECFHGWYGGNTTLKGEWTIAGEVVDPGKIRLPTLLAVPSRDRIVPYNSAMALANMIPHARVISPPAGHVGMVIGRRSEKGLWRPLTEWLKAG